jgi:hypothetical protein
LFLRFRRCRKLLSRTMLCDSTRWDRCMFFARVCYFSLATVSLSVGMASANFSRRACVSPGIVRYRGTAFIKDRINLNALKLLENFSRRACHCDALVFLFYRSPVTPLPERRRNTLLSVSSSQLGRSTCHYALLIRRTSAAPAIHRLALLWSCPFSSGTPRMRACPRRRFRANQRR